jgi:hypothetical protein
MCFGITGMSHPSLAALAHSIKIGMTRESLHEHFSQAAVEFLTTCLNFAIHFQVEKMVRLQAPLLKSFARIMIVDSTCFAINPLLKNLLPGCRSDANCKIQFCYEYLKGIVSFFEITPENCPDGKYSSKVPERILPGDLYLADLGYFKLDTLYKIWSVGAHFISRFFVGTQLFDGRTGEKIDLYAILKNAVGDTFDIPVLMGSAEKNRVPCRLICLRVNEEVANQRRRKMRAKAIDRKRASSHMHLFLAGWTLMVTSVSADCLPAATIRPIYGLRWQIELLFKQLKSVLKINVVNTSKSPRLLCQVLGKMIMAVIIHRCHAEMNTLYWNTSRQEISMDKLYKRVQERAFMIHNLLIKSVCRAIRYLKSEVLQLLNTLKKEKQKSRKTTLEKLCFLSVDSGVAYPTTFD